MRRASQLWLVAAAFATGLALLGAACGGGDGEGEAGVVAAATLPATASLAPASSAGFASLSTDFESEQWQQLEALIGRLPGGQDALAKIGELAVGPEVGIAILELDAAALGSPDAAPLVLFTNPSDPAALEADVAEGKDFAVVKALDDGWYAVADSEAIIDGALAAAGSASLADDPAFEAAMEALPGDAVAKVYLSGAGLTQAFEQGIAESGATGFDFSSLTGANTLESLALALRAEESGFRLDGVALTEGGPEVTTYAAELPAIAPAGALIYASFSDLRPALEQFVELAAQQTPEFDQQLGQLEAGLGISLQDDVFPLFAGEHAFYVREGLPIPEVTLLLSPADPAKGLASLDQLLAAAGAFAGASSETAPAVTPTDIAGIPAKQITIGEGLSLYYAQVGDNLVLTTATAGIADLVSGSGSLAEDPRFVEATEAAALPGQTSGFFYLDFERAAALIELATGALGEQLGGATVPAEGVDALAGLGYLVVHAGGSGNTTTFSGFLGVK